MKFILTLDYLQIIPRFISVFPDVAAKNLNMDLERIAQWAAKWQVGFNAKKTEALLISRRIFILNHRTLFFNHVPIPEVQSHKTRK